MNVADPQDESGLSRNLRQTSSLDISKSSRNFLLTRLILPSISTWYIGNRCFLGKRIKFIFNSRFAFSAFFRIEISLRCSNNAGFHYKQYFLFLSQPVAHSSFYPNSNFQKISIIILLRKLSLHIIYYF